MAYLKHSIPYYTFKVASYTCYKAPIRVRSAVAAVGGELYYWLARTHSRKADENIRRVLGEKEVNRKVRQVARRSFRNYVKYMTELLANPYMTEDQIEQAIASASWENLEGAISGDKGVMVVTVHFGNWDVAGSLVNTRGYKVTSVANSFKPADLNELIQGVRRKRGITIYSPEGALRGLYSAIKRREIVGLVIDSPLKSEGVVVDFFGAPARFAKGPAAIAIKTGVMVLVGFVARQPGNNTYYGMWGRPLDYKVTGNHDLDVQQLTQLIAYDVEKLIRRHPDQWYMFRHLWLNEAEIAEHQQVTTTEKRAGRRSKTNPAAAKSESVTTS